ncbi:hypothetical protein BJV74DRAFT_876690 [Russula compacta]|nr:hypothetical protein BJV74DRAFT_876690 [Russula compacta]
MDQDLTDVALDDVVFAPATREEKKTKLMNVVEALQFIDDHWYKKIAGKKARWMDLIGDYAGNERFILDGESLLQHVLDDPLLALARTGDPSFQILHAIYSMERFLNEMLKRSAVFDIVFWEDTRHLTLKGGTNFLVSSQIYAFSNLMDPAWYAYQRRTKPMFVMLNDGGTPEDTDDDMAMRILIQRNFIFGLLTSGVAVTLLRGAEFRDSKIFSFVLEQRFGLETRKSFPHSLWNTVQYSGIELEYHLINQMSQVSLAPLHVIPSGLNSLDILLKEVLGYLVMRRTGLPDLFWEFTSLFFLHIMILPTLPVSERACRREDLNGDLVALLVGDFLPLINPVMAAFVSKTNRFVDIDGRIFTSVLRYAICHGHFRTHALTELVGPEISSRLETVWRSANAPPPDFITLLTRFLHYRDPEPLSAASFTHLPFHGQVSAKSSSVASDEEVTSFTLLPFHNQVFNDELAVVHVTVSDRAQALSSNRLEFNRGVPFSDTKHWHGHRRTILPKHLGGEEVKDVDERSRQRRLRRDQRFMLQMQRLAATLTGASGGVLQQTLIPPTGRKVSEIIDGRERIRQEHARGKKAKEDSSSQVWWLDQLRQVERMPTYEEKMARLRGLLRNPRTDTGWLSVEVRLYNLHLTIQQWIAEHGPEKPAIHDHYSVSIMRMVKELYTSNSLTGTTLGVLASIMVALGFTDYIVPLEDEASRKLQPDRDLAFSFVKLLKSKSNKPVHKFMAIKEDPVIWQLRVFGEHMDCSMDSASDPRVSFQPDAWQREVLDCLDKPKCSLLVVAPTSAGKTFISFYAMEKVLRESDDGLLVYVAPTKALVNQVAAEVYARFRKEVDGHIGDFASLPPLARTWTPRIRRIILDEIHTIGQHKGGTVWEQIILLAPCPIIGLSATIGKPENFNAWLESVQKAKGFEHEFIHYSHRYSHLRKFAYFPQLLHKDQPFLGLDSVRPPTQLMRFIHPVSTLSFAGTMPPDLSLEASDLLCLYKILTNQGIADAEQLDPVIYFSRDTFIRQKDVLRYEVDIKKILARLLAAPDALDSSSSLQQVVQEIQDPVLKQTSMSQLNAPPSSSVFLSGLIHLLSDMHAIDCLPAILFNFDRQECLTMAAHILDTLESAEEVWRAQSPEWKHKIRRLEAWKARQKNKERAAQKAAARKRDLDDEVAQQTEDYSWESYFDPQDPSPRFSFAGASAYPKEELLADIASLRWTPCQTKIPEYIFRALRRGIAVHHSGMHMAYTALVERENSIFKGTLALGINAPTKSSVFCGDSPFLTALAFRQCAGRAGRRGFDLLGRVVFYGVPLDRINRLLLSRLPRLTGTFPLSSTMVLRLFSLLEGSDYAPYAVHAIRSILRLPHISFGSDVGKSQLLHHLRFSIDYLRRAHLLAQEGNPINLFGIASHLYYTEPSNLAIAVLLQNGVIHDICSQTSSVQAERDLVTLLCHLFGRRHLPEVYATSKIHDLVQNGPSRVVLAPLHPKARAVLLAHQKETLSIFSAYALAFSSQHAEELGPDNRLPLSGGVIGPSDTSARPRTALFAHLAERAVRQPKARSLFVATSGHHDDKFGDVGELVRTVRRGVHLNEHAIPTVERILNPELPLNAYLYDFFVHGQVDALVNMNGIRRGDVWFALKAFYLVLMSIRGDLENLLLSASAMDTEVASSHVREAELDGHLEDASEDSGYQSIDAAEWGEEGDDSADSKSAFKRPRGVLDRDWRVYEVVDSITNEFKVKFKAMWA